MENSLSTYEPHGCVVVYSVVQRASFRQAEEIVKYLWRENVTKDKAVILVGNKADLARSRVIPTSEGKALAKSIDAKFIETSSGIQHNVDELLVGILKQVSRQFATFGMHGECSECCVFSDLSTGHSRSMYLPEIVYSNCYYSSLFQIRLKETRDKKAAAQSAMKMRSSKTHISLHLAKEILQKICLSDITKSKSCENLHVL